MIKYCFVHKISHRRGLNCQLKLPPVDLYLNLEKSSWKTQGQRTEFLACKNQSRN